MPKEDHLKEAFTFATLFLSSGIRDVASSSKSKGVAIVGMVKDRSVRNGLAAKKLGVARFGRFAKYDIMVWDQEGYRRSLMKTLSRHLLLGGAFSRAIHHSPSLAKLIETESVHSGSHVDIKTGLAIGVCGLEDEENQNSSEFLMKTALDYLDYLVRFKKNKDDAEAVVKHGQARFEIARRLSIDLNTWRLPTTWRNPTFWKQKIFTG